MISRIPSEIVEGSQLIYGFYKYTRIMSSTKNGAQIMSNDYNSETQMNKIREKIYEILIFSFSFHGPGINCETEKMYMRAKS